MRSPIEKSRILISLLARHPGEFVDRVRNMVEVRLDRLIRRRGDYAPVTLADALGTLGSSLGDPLSIYLDDPQYIHAKDHLQLSVGRLGDRAPFIQDHNAGLALASMCYALCRVLRPRVVLETGVAYGITSTFILAALDANREGLLHSVDLPPLASHADEFVGALIPSEFRDRWRLVRGTSRRVLPGLLHRLGRVDLFIHDSLHTYWNMRSEFSSVERFLGRPSAVLADDIEGNTAFQEWVNERPPTDWCAVSEFMRSNAFGVSLFV